MTKRMNLKLSIHQTQGEAGERVAYIGYFRDSLSLEQSQLIANLIWSFKNEQLHALVATYLLDEARWEQASCLGWKSYLKKTFTRKAWFPRTIEYNWVVGICPSMACLQEVIYTGWNLSGNESFIMMLAQDVNEVLPRIEQTYQDDLETSEDNELQWISCCPFVFSREHDGLALRLYTLRLSEYQLRQHLETFFKSVAVDVVISTKAL